MVHSGVILTGLFLFLAHRSNPHEMKKIMAIALATLIWACKEEKKEPQIADTMRTYSIEQMMDNESVGGLSFSPDKSKLLVSSNRSGIYNMYTLTANGGEMLPVTQSDSSSVFSISYFPQDGRMLFRMDNNGDELYHIYLRETDGSHRDLTPDPGARSLFYGWAEDNASFYYASNKRDNRFMDLYEMGLEDLSPTLLYQNDGGYDIGGVSPDERFVSLSRSLNSNDSDLFLHDIKSGDLIKINKNQSGNGGQDFSPDGSAFYYITDDGSEFSYLMKYTLADGTHEKTLERDWDIWGSSFTEQGSYQVTFINQDGKNVIEVLEVANGKNLELPQIEDMEITGVGFSDDETMMAFYAGGSHSPSNLYLYDLESKELGKLTEVLNPEIQGQDLVRAEVIRFKSFDSLEIPAIYYRP